MTLIGHIAAGIITSKVTNSPAAAVVAGSMSHAAMDYALPEFRGWPPPKYLPWWAWQVIGSILLLRCGWSWALWGVLGAVLPDLVDGIYSLVNPQAWQRGALICPWHRAGAEIFDRDMSWPLTFAVEAILIYLALR